MGFWFGDPWPSAELRAEVCRYDALRVPVPVGRACLWCHEEVGEDDRGTLVPTVLSDRSTVEQPLHVECGVRMVVGGPLHLLGACSCHLGRARAADDPDLGLTARQAALESFRWVQEHGTLGA